MRVMQTMEQNKDTGGWALGSLLLALAAIPEFWTQVLLTVLGPTLGFTLLFFAKRELHYRFPPKKRTEAQKTD